MSWSWLKNRDESDRRKVESFQPKLNGKLSHLRLKVKSSWPKSKVVLNRPKSIDWS